VGSGRARRARGTVSRLALLLLLPLLTAGCPKRKPTIDSPPPCAEADPPAEPVISFEPDPDANQAAARRACTYRAGQTTIETIGSEALPPTPFPIQHVVVLMLENRSFDHYMTAFRLHPNDDSQPTNLNQLGVPVERTCASTTKLTLDLNHEWEGTHLAYDNGRLDGFVLMNPDSQNIGRETMNYYAAKDLPMLCWLRQNFATSNRYFSSLLGPTWPNRYFLFAATAAGLTVTPNMKDLLREAQIRTLPSLFTLLGKNARVYTHRDPAYTSLTEVMNALGVFEGRPPLLENRPYGDFATDAANGHLPAFALIEPNMADVPERSDDHPPADIRYGQTLIEAVVKALRGSRSWDSTALFITWDEHGGFFDHVPPPRACEPDDVRPKTHRFDRYGFRVPMFVVSPYTPAGAVSHHIADHTSITRFVEHAFGLPALTRRDANAWPLFDLFDWSSKREFPSEPMPTEKDFSCEPMPTEKGGS